MATSSPIKPLITTRNSVAYHLLTTVFALYFLITVALTISQMFLEYRNTKNALQRELGLIHQSFSHSISRALFEINDAQLQAIIDGMISLPTVTGVQIHATDNSFQLQDEAGTVIDEKGRQYSVADGRQSENRDELFWQDFKIYSEDGSLLLGTGRIYSSNQVVYGQIESIFLMILAGAVLKTLALWLLFLWAARSRLNRPITVLSSVIGSVRFEQDEPLQISLAPAPNPARVRIHLQSPHKFDETIETHSGDEIHHLACSFQQLHELVLQKIERLHQLSTLAQQLLACKDTPRIYQCAHQALVKILGIDRLLIFAPIDKMSWQCVYHSDGLATATVVDEAAVITPAGAHTFTPANTDDELFHLLQQNQLTQQILSANLEPGHLLHGVHSATVFPLCDEWQYRGQMLMCSQTPCIANSEDEACLQAVAGLLMIALSNARMFNTIAANQHSLEQDVATRTVQLQRAVKELESFNYAVSHDLRAPLRHINGFIQMLEETLTEGSIDAAKPIFLRIQKSIGNMQNLIEGLLTLAQTGYAGLNKTEISLQTMVREIFADIHEDSKTKVHFDIGELGRVTADATLIRQVLQNLIDNAIKYSQRAASPCVRIEQINTDPSQLTLMIADNGVGFNPQYADKLFTLFQRLHKAEDFPGTGVGLALCAKIIQLHGGRIWAEAEEGLGAKFFISLPK